MQTHQFLLLLSPLAVGSALAQEASGIYKCIIAGKTTYPNTVCRKASAVTEVKIRHARSVVSPDRQTVANTRARIQDQMWVNEAPGRIKTRTITRDGVSNTYPVTSSRPSAAVGLPGNLEYCSEFD